ncbi:diguanylate cyclase [Cellvibrio mixtus]|uniref:cyclic-guanylate-specific phosphodiesterase n=1 Tax=Cellvibrio mixtus TaxID=39650 RepID=A0A266QC51_9GAMM|nr:EAL domain-containing protein [Cellvibrio mixtus]OZY87463.1 diguanylate cyclase [Cellvibrio mixtus]
MSDAFPLLYRRPRLLALAVFLLCLLLSALVVWNLEENYRHNQRADIENIAQNHAFLLRDSLRQVLTLNYSMATLVRLSKGNTQAFDAVAAELLPYFDSVSHISLSPNGIIRQVYPLAGNEKSIGFNQLSDSLQNLEAVRARDSGQMTLTGPVSLVQGGTGVIARLPIFLHEAGESHFWGFANVTIRLSRLLKTANIQQLNSQDIAYKLWRINPIDQTPEAIAVHAPAYLRNTVDKSFDVPNGTWVLTMAPVGGWVNGWRLASEIFLALVISGLLGYQTYLVLKLQRRKINLQSAVQEQTREVMEARAQLQATLDAIPDLLFEVSADGVIHNFHTHRPELLLLDPEDFLGKQVDGLMPKEVTAIIHDAMREASEKGFSNGKYYGLDLPGGRREFELSTACKAVSPEVQKHFVMISRDITERRQAEEELRVAATAFEAREGMMITDPAGVILRVNKAFTEITGYSANEVIGNNPRLLNSGHHEPEFYADMWRIITTDGSWKGEIWNRRRSGEIYPEWLTITAVKNSQGETTHYVSTLTDITERKENEARINNLAFFDPLTQLPNRRLLQDRLEHAIAASTRKQTLGALLFIDLDDFKTLNDNRGHHIGDLLLVAVANRLRMAVRAQDTVARLGGDEFLVVLEDLTPNHDQAAAIAQQIAETILESLNEAYNLEGQDYFSTPSIGISLFGDRLVHIDELLKQADQAMYHAKAEGRNTCRFFDPEMQAHTAQRFALQHEIREALIQHQFQLFYQPQVDYTGAVIGAEALIRWFHPQRGMVSPLEFIPIAEESGLILQLGNWIVEEACHQLVRWSQHPATRELVISINVSARQFQQAQFVMQLLTALQRTGANPHCLKLELTESMLVQNPQDIIAKMDELKNHGIKFSLDDFGTGYSSLAYLKRLPINELKIDKSFVNDVLVDSNDAAIARMIIRLAQSMELRVIAEGVETKAQRDWLEAQGCLHYQGYYFGKPVAAAEFGNSP